MRSKSMITLGIIICLAGCANSEVVYVDNDVTSAAKTLTETVVTTENSTEIDDDTLEGYKWVENVSFKDRFGEQYEVKIKATSEIANKDENISVYTCNVVDELTPAQKEKIMRIVCGDERIYLYEDADIPKDHCQSYIDYYQALIEQNGEDEGYTLEIEKYTDMLSKAPTSLKEAGDFEGDTFYFAIGDLHYKAEFGKPDSNGDGHSSFSINMIFELSKLTETTNKLSESDAQTMALDILEKTGFEEFKCTNVMTSSNFIHSDESEKLYMVYFRQGHTMVPDSIFSGGLTSLDKNGNKKLWNFKTNTPNCATLYINENGIIEMFNFSSPIEIIDETKDVNLLKLPNIVESIRNELVKNGEKLDIMGGETFDQLQLIFIGVTDKENNLYYEIPCWSLNIKFDFGYLPAKGICVNAIDGSVVSPIEIDFKYEKA